MITDVTVSSESINVLEVKSSPEGGHNTRVTMSVIANNGNVHIYLDKDDVDYLIKELQRHKKDLK